jgi:hypothetical protein
LEIAVVKIVYADKKIEKQCTSIKEANKLFGGNKALAVSLLARINAIEQADVIHDIMSTGVSAPRFRRYSQAKIMAENAVDTALKSGKAIEEYLVSSQHDINIMLSS